MQMNKKELEAFAKEAAKGIKTAQDLNEFSLMLKEITVEAALNAEMEDGEFELETPRDRDGTLEPKLVKKHQSRITSMDEKILWLYAQGMSTREIVQDFDEWYGVQISPTLISRVTNAVIDQVVDANS
jgi:putative transposase